METRQEDLPRSIALASQWTCEYVEGDRRESHASVLADGLAHFVRCSW